MKYIDQIGTKDCFSACFQNALRHFNVPISPELKNRLEVFNNGTQSCSIFASEERIAEAYGKSLDKFMAEWRWAGNHKDSDNWANHLLNKGVEIALRNGPIEQKQLFIDSLNYGKVCICEINETGKSTDKSLCKHAILVVRCLNGILEAHDTKTPDMKTTKNTAITYVDNPNGTNLEIDCEYFFSREIDCMKPGINEYQQDYGYKFMIVSKVLNETF